MNCRALLAAGVLLAAVLPAQQGYGPPNTEGVFQFGSVAGTGILGQAVYAGVGGVTPSTYTLAWSVAGAAPVACTFYPQGSVNGKDWYTLATASQTSTAPLDCTTPAMVHFAQKPVLYFRVAIMAYTPGDATTAVTMNYLRGPL